MIKEQPSDSSGARPIANSDDMLHIVQRAQAGMRRVNERLSEPLAIIGVGCRFPSAENPAAFWELLSEGRSADQREGQRWGEEFDAPVTQNETTEKAAGKITCPTGGFLDEVDQFEPEFFGISGREAKTLDPQQRLLLEVAWETFENAAVNPWQWKGRSVGVFVGMCSNDYLHRLACCDPQEINAYLGTGNSHGAAAGRLSYVMDWHGPSMAVDTACSSSLVALHTAARALRYGDCEMAVVMGVNLILAPQLSVSLSQAGMLSPTGHCHTFDDSADGFVRGEGCGGILVKRLSRAIADGDPVLCVIRGTAANQDGRSSGLTAPNGTAQERAIRDALRDAKMQPDEVDYVEAHGTGTSLGDPIEMEALRSVFGSERNAANPLRVGSVKTNIGHLEGAAGIAGVIKVALAMKHQKLPAHLHFHSPSKHIRWDWPVRVTAASEDWSRTSAPRVAGISSFGFGGSNAHVILSDPPTAVDQTSIPNDQSQRQRTELGEGETRYLVFSGRCQNALRQQAANLSAWLLNSQDPMRAIEATAAMGRAHFEHRAVVFGRTRQEWVDALDAFDPQASGTLAQDWQLMDWMAVERRLNCDPETALHVKHALCENYPAFASAIARCESALEAATASCPIEPNGEYQERHLHWFAIQFAICQWLFDSGVRPKQVGGRGAGAIAAGAAAGTISLDAACRLAVACARLQNSAHQGPTLAPTGATDGLATETPKKWLNIQPNGSRCSVVAMHPNGVITKHMEAAENWLRLLRPASHTGIEASDDFGPILIEPHGCEKSVSGRSNSSDVLETDASGEWTVQRIVQEIQGTVLRLMTDAYLAGNDIAWETVYGQDYQRVSMPTYPFQRRRVWYSETTGVQFESPKFRCTSPRLLSAPLSLATEDTIFETDLKKFDYLQDHCVGGTVIFPAAGYLQMAWTAGETLLDSKFEVRDLQIQRALVIDQDVSAAPVQLVVSKEADGLQIRFASLAPRGWETIATCRISTELTATVPVIRDVEKSANRQWNAESHYHRIAAQGIDYGEWFQGVCHVASDGEFATGTVLAPAIDWTDHATFHPACLDACLQVAAGVVPDDSVGWLPVGFSSYRWLTNIAPGTPLTVRCAATPSGNLCMVDLVVEDPEGETVAILRGMQLRSVDVTRWSNSQHRVGTDRTNGHPENDWRNLPADEQTELILSMLRTRVAEVLDSAPEEVRLDKPLSSLGLDSLMAFELREELEEVFATDIPIEVLLRDTDLQDLSRVIAFSQAPTTENPETLDAAQVSHSLDELHGGDTWVEGAL